MRHQVSQQRAPDARDTGLARLRRLTSAAVAAAFGLSAVFAGVAASSTHPRKARTIRVRSTQVETAPALPPAQAPSLDREPTAPPPTPPPSPPTPAVSAPVVVSGGS
jgi:type IV secretory pathway VirB10-like protein